MRDYSFGNYISALRERRGLSQYQLGALVGVSDKAVSKWENAASTPRIGTIRKLAEVLEVSVDELLACEYSAFNRERKDLFAMKYEIIRMARKKMTLLYGENPPFRIMNRFKMEELILKEHEMLLWMGFFGKLQEEYCKNDIYFEIRGAHMGASFIGWLLGGTNVNPLAPHYYCPDCKKIEFISDEKCGIDLPEKMCSCGRQYKRDGFEISEMNMYPLNKYHEIYVSRNALEYVRKCMLEYFAGYGLVREINVICDNHNDWDTGCNSLKRTSFVVFSDDMIKKYPDPVINISHESYYDMIFEQSVLAVVVNSDETITAEDVKNGKISKQIIKEFFADAVDNDRFKGEYIDFSLEKAYSKIKSPSFQSLLSLYGFMHGTNAWSDNAEHLIDKGIALEELIYCREDLYAYIYKKLKDKCCENPSGLAFGIREDVRRGKYAGNRMPREIEKILLECDVPEWYVESMKKIHYLYPKTNLIVQLKRDLCTFIKDRKAE